MIHASLPLHQDRYRDGHTTCSPLTRSVLATRSTGWHARPDSTFCSDRMARLTWADSRGDAPERHPAPPRAIKRPPIRWRDQVAVAWCRRRTFFGG
jgi:hypothetical protein